MKIAEFFAQNAFSPDIDTDALLAEFDRQMDAGLAGGKSSLAMIPAYVDADRAVKTDTPINVLDAGGTNLRVATVRFDATGKAKIEGLRKCAMPGTDGIAHVIGVSHPRAEDEPALALRAVGEDFVDGALGDGILVDRGFQILGDELPGAGANACHIQFSRHAFGDER